MPDKESVTEAATVVLERQVACQFCKYLLEGALLGDCRVTRWIGSGAFGDVYEAEQLPPLSRRVAIKVMAIDRVADGKSSELFAREVRAIAALDHPNILSVLRVGMIEDGRSYLVMKYAAHGSLQKFCELTTQGQALPPVTLPTQVLGAKEDQQDSVLVEKPEEASDLGDETGSDSPASDTGEVDADRGVEKEEVTSEEISSPSISGEERLVADDVPTRHVGAGLAPALVHLTPQQLLPYL